jgi:hypothetical protein
MTRKDLEQAVWRHFPHRTREHWELTLTRHHTWTRNFPVYQWDMMGKSAKQDSRESWGFVDPGGVEVVL